MRLGSCGDGRLRARRLSGEPATRAAPNGAEELRARGGGREVDGHETVRETLGDIPLELDVTDPVRADGDAERVAGLLAAVEVGGHLDRLSESKELRSRPLDTYYPLRPHTRVIGVPGGRATAGRYGIQLATRSGAP